MSGDFRCNFFLHSFVLKYLLYCFFATSECETSVLLTCMRKSEHGGIFLFAKRKDFVVLMDCSEFKFFALDTLVGVGDERLATSVRDES